MKAMKTNQQSLNRPMARFTDFMQSEEDVPVHRHRAILDRIREGYALATADGHLLSVNLAFAQMLGCQSHEEALALNLHSDIFANPYERIYLMKEARDKCTATMSVSWRRRDYTQFEVMVSYYGVKKECSKTERFEIVVEDLTEKNRLESQLMHSQRLQSLGQLAGGMAHDFNNMLTVIYGSASLLSYDLKSQPHLVSQLERIISACKQASELTKNLLCFSHQK